MPAEMALLMDAAPGLQRGCEMWNYRSNAVSLKGARRMREGEMEEKTV